MPVVYLDIVWVINLVMDTVLLMTAGWIAKRPLRPRRLLGGGLIGSLYALLLFVPPLSLLTTWPGKAIVSLIMVWVGIPCRSWLELARVSVLFYFVSFVFAGAAIAVHYAVPGTTIGHGTIVSGNQLAFTSGIEGLALLVAIPLGVGVIRFTLHRVRRLKTEGNSLYDVTVICDEKEVSFTGLADTGNQLRDPISRRPVCLLDADLWMQLVPEGLQTVLGTGTDVLTALTKWDGGHEQQRFTLIPFRGAGSASGLTVGFRPDAVVIEGNGGRVNADSNCLFALHDGKLAADGRFQAILHIDVITGDDNFENDFIASEAQSQTSDSISTSLD